MGVTFGIQFVYFLAPTATPYVGGTVIATVPNGSLGGGGTTATTTTSFAASGTYYVYAHLSAFAPGLAKGSKVLDGQLIGYVGDTGNSGPGNFHLHFEIHPGGGSAVDPLPLLSPLPSACTVFG